MESINSRVRYLRKEILKMNQRVFAKEIGMKQTSVSSFEQEGATVTEQVKKILSTTWDISIDWLENGTLPIFIEKKEKEFNLDDYARERGASEFDLKLLKAYLGLDKEVRDAIMEQFRNEFGNQEGIFKPVTVQEIQESYSAVPDDPAELEKLAVDSDENAV
ncbi:MAG TPA: helix-turn-helix transcriptional regulator [Candidatus Scybalomonas excrementigallinarum]|nr:helix-turn-helix transcriptional regulator [Candidatus Scybalomonas excrementigallinarum]